MLERVEAVEGALEAFLTQYVSNASGYVAHPGKFRASELSRLMGEPRSITDAHMERYGHLVPEDETWTVTKTGPNAGEKRRVAGYAEKLRAAAFAAGTPIFSEGALSYIDQIAWERVTGRPAPSGGNAATERGNYLEPVALYLLNKHWSPLSKGDFYPLRGYKAGATPDVLLSVGQTSGDLKCPVTYGHLVSFSHIANNDHEAFAAWDVDYYWQVMMQQLCCEVEKGYLILFDDRAALIQLNEEERDTVQKIIDFMVERVTEEKGFGYRYEYGSDGFAFCARWFKITDEIKHRIQVYLKAADEEADRRAAHFLANMV